MFGKKVMRTLYLVRHGKASLGDMGVSDRERMLEQTGVDETRRMAESLIKDGIQVDLMVCSDATRTYQTAVVMAEALSFPIEKIKQNPLLYLADEDRLMTEVMALPDEVKTVVLVAHNPGVTDLANLYLDRSIYAMPPSALVGLRFKMNQWNEIANHRGQVIRTLPPHASF